MKLPAIIVKSSQVKSSQVNLLPSNRDSDFRRKLYPLIFVLFSVLSLVYLFFFSSGSEYIWEVDLPTQWRICAYTLRGIDIYPLRGSDAFIAEIGKIGRGFQASPWGCLLQNIFYGGFLSFEAAKIYYLVAITITLLIASFVLRAKIMPMGFGGWAFILSLFSIDFFQAVTSGNAGGMICAFLLIAWLVCDDHPYVAGVLIAFAMVKPQTALIVCIMLLMMRRIKPLIVGAAVDIAAWFTVSVMTKKGMLELVREFLFMPQDKVGNPPFAGIFTLLFDDYLTAVAMSMIAGIIFVVVLYVLLPKGMPEIFKIYPAFMAVTFWCYAYSNEGYILLLPACLCLWLMLHGRSKLFWFICAAWCYLGAHIKSITRKLFMLANPGLDIVTSRVYARTLYELVIILVGFLICIELRRIYPEVRQ